MPFALSFATGPPSRSRNASGSASPGLSLSIRNLRTQTKGDVRRQLYICKRPALYRRATAAHLRNEFDRFDIQRPRNALLFAALQTLPVIMCSFVVLSSPGMQLCLQCQDHCAVDGACTKTLALLKAELALVLNITQNGKGICMSKIFPKSHQLVHCYALPVLVDKCAAVAPDCGCVHRELLVLVALAHSAPHAGVERAQVRCTA